MKEFGHTPSPDIGKNRELGHETIRNVVDLWSMAVIGSEVEHEVSSESGLREMMHRTLLEQAMHLVESWNLQPDPEVIEKIRQEQDPQLKAQLQEAYIHSLGVRIQNIVRSFDQSPPRSSKWDSWPQRMKERERFNCVGAILLGSALLDQADIESSIGNPTNHVVNMARLANGDWWYVDLMNGGNQIRRVTPSETKLGPTPVLRLDEPEIDYRLVPLYSMDEIPVLVLGNLASLQHDAQEKEADDEILAAREYASRFSDTFQRVDLSELTDRLYPHAHDVQLTDEMREETERINRLYSDDRSMRQLIEALSHAELLSLIADLRDHIDPVRVYLLEAGDLPAELEDPARAFLIAYRDSLARVAQGNEEEYKRLVEGRLAKILAFKT